MADLKISQLPAATTPLAGTEELPVVQGGVTDKVTVANLTAGRAIASSSITVAAGAVGTPSVTTSGDTNTGVFFPAADQVALAAGGVQGIRAEAAVVTALLPVALADGTVSAPSLANTGDLNTGLYFPADNTVALTADGTQALKAESTAVTAAVPVVLPAGTNSAPGLAATGDLNTGLYFPAADTVALTAGGTQAIKAEAGAVTAAVPVVLPAGTVSAPALAASGDLNTGVWFPAADTVAISEGGVEALRINSSAEVILGNGDTDATPAARTLRGTDGTGTNVAAADLTIRPGLATGNAASGALVVQTGPAGASGTTLQTATERLRVLADGTVIVGNGNTAASPNAASIRGTNGTGTNVAAGNLTITPGLATGNAASGALIVQTGPAGASGSTLQTATERLRVTATGRLGVGTNAPATTFDLAGAYSANVTAMGALDVDCSAGNYFTKTINGNSTFTVSNVPASRCYSFTLELTHTSGTITWFSGVEWPNGTAPTLTTGKTHLFMFLTDDGGTRWRASALTNYTT